MYFLVNASSPGLLDIAISFLQALCSYDFFFLGGGGGIGQHFA